ncbi:MAG: hypothetical protein M3Y64_04450, partial [Gemmatimonadota bacterium]|nr:hypothetical protein [Gemmatimonadota bacterium]
AAGQWSGELPVGKTHLRALLKGGAADCWSAQHDTTITLGAGQPNDIYLDVATCSVLVLNVTPDDAEFTISSEDFSSTPKKARSAGLAMPFVLRNGVYRITAKADRCFLYNDTILVKRNPGTNSDTVARTINMLCN